MHVTNFKHEIKTRVDDRIQQERDDDAKERALHKAVDTRDKRKCRACGRRSNPDAVGLTQRGHRHHLTYRSAGGPDESWNVATLCYVCHNDEHKHRLRVDGNADEALAFWRKDVDGHWYLWRREISVGVFEKD